MVRYIILFFVLLFISCGTKTKILDNKITDVPIDNEIFKNKKFFEKKLLSNIDTNFVYEENYSYQSNKYDFKNILNKKNYRVDYRKSYYKFYSNGCVNYFTFGGFDEVTLSSINPNFDGQRGVVYSKGNEMKLDLFTITGYSFKRDYGIITNILKVKGDTIFEKKIKDLTYVNVYVKRKIPKEFLIYKPDW